MVLIVPMRKLLQSLLSLVPMLLAADCLKDPSSFRLTLKHREANGIGYDQGYSSLDAFFTFSSIGHFTPFFDLRAHLFNDGKPAANTGFGVRYLPEQINASFGLNGFFDFKQTHHSAFEQAGGGVEILGTKWGFRANGYLPIISRNNLYSSKFMQFQGHYALFQEKRELAFKGFDTSLERVLWRRSDFDLSAHLGGYMFFADYDQSAKGGLFKLTTNLSRYCSLEGQVSYDSLFKWIAQGQAALSIPFGKRVKTKRPKSSCSKNFALAQRLTEEVSRFEIIVSNPYHQQIIGGDIRTTEPLYLVFVDNSATAFGNGTAESPYNTLLAAQNGSSPGDMIYVFGTNIDVGLNQGILLQNSQWLQSSSYAFSVSTPSGPATVPAQTTITPVLSNPSNTVITLANSNIVNGFFIQSGNAGIFGDGITNFTLTSSSLSQNTTDIELFNVLGEIRIQENSFYSDQGLVFIDDQSSYLTLEDNTFANAVNGSFDIEFEQNATGSVLIQSNSFEGGFAGSLVQTSDSSSATVHLLANTFSDLNLAAPYAVSFVASNTSSLIVNAQDNRFTSPTIAISTTSQDSANAELFFVRNIAFYSGSGNLYPFTLTADSSATASSKTTLLLLENVANSSGYLLTNDSSSATFNIQSPTLSLTGVKILNAGSFTLDGTFNFIRYERSSIPSSP